MAKKQYELIRHTFTGGRFDDHGIDVDVLPDLIAFKNLLVETAKELWRRKNPDRQRLPKNFEDSLSLKFYQVEAGSAAIPLIREVEISQELLPSIEPPEDELDEAARLVPQAIDAVSVDSPLPVSFPKNAIPLFQDYGKTLRPDEGIELEAAKSKKVVRYSQKERARLSQLAQKEYEDVVDLVGEIRAADLDRGDFAIRLADETKVFGKFSPEQEATIIEALQEHSSRRLHLKGRARYFPDGKLNRIISVSNLMIQVPGEQVYDETAAPIWEVIAKIGASVPKEEWAKVPSDASKNLDHYLYGKGKVAE